MVREWFKTELPCGNICINNFEDGMKVSDKIPQNIIDFIKESNKIENQRNTLVSIKQQLEAFYYLMSVSPEELTHRDIRNVHLIISKGILREDYRGIYRPVRVWIGNDEGCSPLHIHYEMDKLIKDIKEVNPSEDSIWDIHHRFEIIHPYVDMNGRVGRLILNWLLSKKGFPIKIIKFKDRFDYYNLIRKYRENIHESLSIQY